MSERKVKSRSRLFSFSFRSMCQYLDHEATIRNWRRLVARKRNCKSDLSMQFTDNLEVVVSDLKICK